MKVVSALDLYKMLQADPYKLAGLQPRDVKLKSAPNAPTKELLQLAITKSQKSLTGTLRRSKHLHPNVNDETGQV
jgi:hypothetical protein